MPILLGLRFVYLFKVVLIHFLLLQKISMPIEGCGLITSLHQSGLANPREFEPIGLTNEKDL